MTCDGYEQAAFAVAGRARHWHYLQYLEETTGCCGWCRRRPHLWVDSTRAEEVLCSIVVQHKMKGKAQSAAYQLMIYAILALLGFLVWMTYMGPFFGLAAKKRATEPLHWYSPT